MGLLDGIFGYFGSLGATVTQTVTGSQPAPSGGGTYSGGGTTATSQPSQPVQVQAQSPFSDPVGWIGGATSFVSSGVQTIVSPIVRPIQNAVPMVAAVAASPAIVPMAIGAAIMGGVQSFTSPQQQPITQPAPPPITPARFQQPIEPTTFNVPYGSQAKIQIEDAKMVYDPTGGGVGFSQVPQSQPGFNRIYGFVTSSGGPGALQSGQFTQGEGRAGTPVVYTQRGAATGEFAAGVDVAAAMDVINNPEKYSRQGAEAYGGTVQILDNRVLAPDTPMSRYPAESGNLANLVNPVGTNLPKDQWAEIPWKIQGFESAPTIQAINVAGTMTPVGERELASIGMVVPTRDTSIGGAPIPATGMGENIGGAPIPPTQGASIGGAPIPPATNRSFLEQLNYDVGGFLGIRASGLEQTSAGLPAPFRSTYAEPVTKQPDLISQFTAKLQDTTRMTFAAMPGGIGLGIVSDTVFAIVRKEPTALPFYNSLKPDPSPSGITEEQYNKNLGEYNAALAIYNTDLGTYQKGGATDKAAYLNLQTRSAELQTTKQTLESEQKTVVPTQTLLDKIGKVYEDLNVGLAPYTTDVSGIGRTLKGIPDAPDIPQTQVANLVKGTYIGASQHPLDIALTFVGGGALSYGEGIIKTGVAKAAMYKGSVPAISTVGRLASTPVAADVISIGKAALGTFIIAESGLNIISQPTTTGKGEALGRTAMQFTGFGIGMGSVKMAEPENTFAGRGFFSRQIEMGPLEKTQFKIETALRSGMTEQPGAYREVASMVLPGRTVEPMIKAEPEFRVLSKSGPYAGEIKATIIEQPHSVIGSSSVIQQYPKGIATESGLRYGRDVDVLIESPTKALTRLSTKTGLSEVAAKEVMDVHPIPRNYPGLKPSVEPDLATPESSFLTRMFGDPYRKIATPRSTSEVITPGKGYTGDITYEASQVQFGRKAAAVSNFLEVPIQAGYRGEKDIYDLITIYRAQRAVAVSTGTPESKFATSDKAMKSFMERTFTYGTEKGQRPGDQAQTITRSAQEIFTIFSQKAAQSRTTVSSGGIMPGEMELTFGSRTPEPGIVSSVLRSAVPSGVWRSSAFALVSPQTPSASSASSAPSAPSASSAPSAPTSPISSESVLSTKLPSPPPNIRSSGARSLIELPSSIISGISSLGSSMPSPSSSISSLLKPPSLITSPSPTRSPSPSAIPSSRSSLPSSLSSSPPTPALGTTFSLMPTSIISPTPSSKPTPSPPSLLPPIYIPPPPPVTVPGFGALPPGGGGSPFGKKRRRNFLETFWMGLDVAGPIMKPPKGMQPPKLKRSGIPGGRQKVKVTRRKKK